MSRPKRINLIGCIYHIICRANRDDVVFEDSSDKERFLEYLGEYSEQFDIRIHVYCLMDTHFHLLIESRKTNLSEFMRRLLTAYTVWFHRKHQTHGHLFAGRFKSLVVERGDYLVAVSRYIHQNPVEASLVKNAEDYSWSSMRVYAGKESPGFVYTKEILSWFGNRRQKYIQFIHEGLDEEIKTLVRFQSYVGSEAFVKRMNIRLKRENQPRAMTKEERRVWQEEERWKEGYQIAERMIKDICSNLRCSREKFIKMRRKTGVYRKSMIQLIMNLRKESEWTFRHIGKYLNCSPKYVQLLFYEAQREGL